MLELDHLAIAAETLEAGRVYVEDMLGVPLQPGGQHDYFGTHNALLGLADGLYLEVIAIDPDASKPAYPRWFDLDRFDGAPRITNWICRSQDLDQAVAMHPGAGTPVALERGDLRWRMAVPSDGILPMGGGFPALMQWSGQDHPAKRLSPSGCRLTRLTVTHPEADALRDQLAGHLVDHRIVIEVGAPGFETDFETPSGRRVLR